MLRQKLRNKIRDTESKDALTKWQDGKLILDLAPISLPLPTVSIVTITKDREHLFGLPIHNWKHFKYPETSIEWVIVDDSKTDSLKSLLPQDPRIKYFYIDNHLAISTKRNYAVSKCTGKIIVNMDDDDIHFNDSILAKVRTLQTYPDKQCVFSLPVGIYDLKNGSSQISDSLGEFYPESSLAFYKTFWEEGKFGELPPNGEWYYFAKGRKDKFINIPFWFNFLLCNHGGNVTATRKSKIHEGPSFDLLLTDETKNVISSVRKSL
jgi:glycosyltransferase involved in cell wall biosynthesis